MVLDDRIQVAEEDIGTDCCSSFPPHTVNTACDRRRWSTGAHRFIHDLVRLRAQRAPSALRGAAASAWARRWRGVLSAVVQLAVTSTALGRPWPAATQPCSDGGLAFVLTPVACFGIGRLTNINFRNTMWNGDDYCVLCWVPRGDWTGACHGIRVCTAGTDVSLTTRKDSTCEVGLRHVFASGRDDTTLSPVLDIRLERRNFAIQNLGQACL